MDSDFFPTVALVRDGQPMNPVRIYAGPKVDDHDQIVVFISEFQPPPNLIKAIAATVLDWAQDARCNLLVCPEGLIVDAREDRSEEHTSELQSRLHLVCRLLLEKKKVMTCDSTAAN